MPSDDEILRIAAQFDVGEITAGMSEAATTVQAGTSKMNDAFSNLAAAQIRVKSANKDLQDALNATVSKGLTPTVAATEEVASAMYEAKVATDAFKSAQEEAYGATERLAGGVNNSRIAFTGLTQDLGLRGSRALGSFISQSESLAPILQAAFPVVAAIAFFEILEAGYTKILDVTAAMAGWTKEAKHMSEMLVELNQQQVAFNEHLEIQKLSLSDVGLKGAALDSQKQVDALREKKIVQDAYNESFQREKNIRAELDALHTPQATLSPGLNALEKIFPSLNTIGEGDKIAVLNKELDEAMKRTNELGNQLKTLDQVTIPKGGLETSAKQREEAQRYHDTLARLADEDEARTQRDAEKELREFEKVMNERERMEEELEKTTLELAKKDLESFQHSIIEKTRIQEQFGRDEIEQIKAATDAQSKSLQAKSFAGAADPGLLEIADKALDAQAFKIMDLIALEEKLRATLIQTGLAESDPKIQESLGRQQQLVQQLTVAMQKYDQAVQKAANDDARDFIKSFDAITSKFNSSILSWVNGTETFGKAMQKVWLSLADTAIESLLKIAEQELIGLLLHKTIADEQKLDDAKTAAAGAYAATAGVPVIGPVLAPAAAAAAFAAVLAFEKGGIMPNATGLALLHPREMVLPSNISQSVQRMASGGTSGAGRSSGPMHVHINVSGQPSSSDLKAIESHIVTTVKRARRRGSF